MFWIPLLMGASAILQKSQQNAQIKSQNKINEANTLVANAQQNGNSIISSAKGALNRMNQSIQTRDALKGYGSQLNDLEDRKVKLGEQMTTGSFKNRLNAAESMGAIAARSSAAGVGGSTVDMLSSTMQIQADMQQADIDQQYSDNLFAVDDAEKTNLYNQYGITQQQNVYLDDVAATPIYGPAKIPTNSVGNMAVAGALSFLQGASSTGEFSKGGNLDISGAGTKLNSWFNGASSAGASFFQLGGRS